MDILSTLADHSIRRALGFAGLGIAILMMALSFDMALALRVGADLLGVVCAGMLIAAWTVRRRDMRRTELWLLLQSHAAELAQRLPKGEVQRRLADTLRERLVWHAERVGLAAVLMWLAAGGAALLLA